MLDPWCWLVTLSRSYEVNLIPCSHCWQSPSHSKFRTRDFISQVRVCWQSAIASGVLSPALSCGHPYLRALSDFSWPQLLLSRPNFHHVKVYVYMYLHWTNPHSLRHFNFKIYNLDHTHLFSFYPITTPQLQVSGRDIFRAIVWNHTCVPLGRSRVAHGF